MFSVRGSYSRILRRSVTNCIFVSDFFRLRVEVYYHDGKYNNSYNSCIVSGVVSAQRQSCRRSHSVKLIRIYKIFLNVFIGHILQNNGEERCMSRLFEAQTPFIGVIGQVARINDLVDNSRSGRVDFLIETDGVDQHFDMLSVSIVCHFRKITRFVHSVRHSEIIVQDDCTPSLSSLKVKSVIFLDTREIA